MALTIEQLAEAVRVTVSGMPPQPYLGILTRALAVAVATIDEYAVAAPETIKDEAAIRFVGYVLEAPLYARQPAQPFVNSGSKALLSPWHAIAAELI